MCFSAEISFGASAVITVVGIISYKKAMHTSYRLLAMIPIFFGIQQFMEGVVWIASENEQYSGLLKSSTFGFIFFAWIVWPSYIPYTFYKLEKDHLRKKIISFLLIPGILLSLLLGYSMINNGLHATIQDCSISYTLETQYSFVWFVGIFYLMTTVVPSFISSIPKMWILGVIYFASFFATKIFYKEHVISIWCFFAAISSVLILWFILQNNKSKTIHVK